MILIIMRAHFGGMQSGQKQAFKQSNQSRLSHQGLTSVVGVISPQCVCPLTISCLLCFLFFVVFFSLYPDGNISRNYLFCFFFGTLFVLPRMSLQRTKFKSYFRTELDGGN